MKKPVVGQVKWKKGKTIVPVNCYFCPDCGGILDEIGTAIRKMRDAQIDNAKRINPKGLFIEPDKQ